MKHQMLLVSGQAMPNFLPILNPELKPDAVTLMVSDKMKKQAMWLKAEIVKHGVEILPDLEIGNDETDVAKIQDHLLDWVDQNKELADNSVLNVTGGTKPMAIAAQEVYRMNDCPVFYVDVATDNVSWLSKQGEQRNMRLEKSPTINQVLSLNGITLQSGDFKSQVENEKWRHFCSEIASSPEKWALCLGELNKAASDAVENYKWARNSREKADALASYGKVTASEPVKWNELKEILHADELVRGETANESFVSQAAARFCAGGWLEHYVFEKLKGLGLDRKRALMNAQIVDAGGNSNELDSIVVHRNTCFVIEDKTKNMIVKGGIHGNVADQAVYKLAQVTKRLGLRTKGILVSARLLRPEDKDRARAYDVEVIDWLPDVESQLRRIIGL